MLSTENYKIKQYSETPLDDLLKEYAESREEFNEPALKPETPDHQPGAIPGSNAPDTSAADPPGTEDPSGVTKELSAEQKREIKGKREFTAKFLAKNTDRAFAFLNSMIADSDDPDEWKAEPEDVQDMQECYLEMCQAYGWSGLPPWLNLVMCILFTYGPMAKEAYKVRGINKELAAKAAQAEADKLIEAQARRLENQKRIQAEKDLQAEKDKKETPHVDPPADIHETPAA